MKSNTLWAITWAVLAVAALLVLPVDALADNPFEDATKIVRRAVGSGRQFAYIMAAAGALVLAILAFFGKFKWNWFFMICGGLFIIAFFSDLLTFIGASDGEQELELRTVEIAE